MRTFASRQEDLRTKRYSDTDLMQDVDATTVEGAKAILVSAGGRKASRRALATLWKGSKDHRAGWVTAAKIDAPVRVLQALCMTGLVEAAEDSGTLPETADLYLYGIVRGISLRFRLTNMGKAYAQKAEKTASRK